MHFSTKSYLKSTRNHTAKHAHPDPKFPTCITPPRVYLTYLFARFDFRVEKFVYVDQGEFKDGSNPPRFEKFLKLLLNV
jgi:hypothetical protein